MEKAILLTTDFKQIDKRQWPKFVNDFLEDPDINAIHRLENKIFIKRFNTESYPRLLFYEEKDENGNIIYVSRKYFNRHEEYDAYNKQSLQQRLQKFKYSAKEKEEMQKRFEQFVEVKPKPSLPLEMRDPFRQRDFSNRAGTYVFEMEDYCNHFHKKEFEDDKKELFSLIQNIIINKQYKEDNQGWIIGIFSEGKEIALRRHDNGKHSYFFLFDIAKKIDLEFLKNKYFDLSNDRLLRQARKGYPDWILYVEFETWKILENDDESNLALSDEEIDVLNNTPYPFFINGLAGSGKSTILHYLFSLAYAQSLETPKDLLFISYSKKLVEKANIIIKSLLKTGSHHLGSDIELTEEDEKKLSNCFWSFQDYLICNILNTEEELKRFSSDKHITFDIFQKEYEDDKKCPLHNKHKYNAVMVWSVIRTFIKGRDHHSYFTVEQYRELPESDRTVNPTDYKNIYEIWEKWYHKNYKDNYWDDLDLVRHILDKIEKAEEAEKDLPEDKKSIKKFDIIYCDETQDFTPIENRLIISLSKYSNYNIADYKNVPIAYAGDPNQTVIPTGFSWKRLKDIFDQSFIEMGQHISLEEKPLNNNYRSKRTIVEFANSIQFIRKCFLSEDALNPQEQWNPQANPLPGLFIINTNEENRVTSGFEMSECIITGEDGDYETGHNNPEYVGNGDLTDSLLSNIKNKSKLYTAKSAKGLEFKAVILYKFAEHLPGCFNKILNNETLLNESEKYDLAHFFTKLYIAVTRAKEVLYIIDTQENYEKFWIHFIDNTYVNWLIKLRPDCTNWTEKTGGIEIGNVTEYLHRLEENFDPKETARKFKEEALITKDPKLMRKAADYYNEAGCSQEAEECHAFVLLFNKKYSEAGQKFLRIGDVENASFALWEGKCWEELQKSADSLIYKMTAEYMLGKRKLTDFISINGMVEKIKRTDETWTNVVMKISEDLDKKLSDEYLAEITEFIEKLTDRGFTFLTPKIAELYFRHKKYANAIRKWEETGNVNHKRYFEAKEALSTTKSEEIYWMSRSGKNKDILEKYSDPNLANVLQFDERAKRIIFQLLLNPETFDKAMNYPIEADDKMQRLYRTDAIQFIQKIVLKNFNETDYYKWVEDPVTKNNSEFFTQNLPASFFEDIFQLPETEDWMRFMKLADPSGERVMKYRENYNTIADTLNVILPKRNYYIPLASCFLDIVFNTPDYNYANAAKYTSTIVNLFLHNNFYKNDFRLNTRRNKYFDFCGLKGSDVDFIKEHIRDYAEKKITSYRRIKPSDFETIKTLCRIVEKTVPFIQSEMTGRFEYDADFTLDFYKRMLNIRQCPNELKEFFKIRRIIVEAQNTMRMSFKRLSQLINEKYSFSQLIQNFDREDAAWFIKVILGRRGISRQAVELLAVDVAALIYKYGFIMREFDSRASIRRNAETMTDMAIEKILSERMIDDHALKLTAYVWEIMLENNIDIAKKYDELSKNDKLRKLYRLVEYLQRRALYHYSYSGKELFDIKEEEYGIHDPIYRIQDAKRPKIEEKVSQGDKKVTVTRIDKDTMIGGINIELQLKRKTIWFTKNELDLATIEKGKITHTHNSVKVEGSSILINKDFRVNILSESSCIINHKNTLYEIKM